MASSVSAASGNSAVASPGSIRVHPTAAVSFIFSESIHSTHVAALRGMGSGSQSVIVFNPVFGRDLVEIRDGGLTSRGYKAIERQGAFTLATVFKVLRLAEHSLTNSDWEQQANAMLKKECLTPPASMKPQRYYHVDAMLSLAEPCE